MAAPYMPSNTPQGHNPYMSLPLQDNWTNGGYREAQQREAPHPTPVAQTPVGEIIRIPGLDLLYAEQARSEDSGKGQDATFGADHTGDEPGTHDLVLDWINTAADHGRKWWNKGEQVNLPLLPGYPHTLPLFDQVGTLGQTDTSLLETRERLVAEFPDWEARQKANAEMNGWSVEDSAQPAAVAVQDDFASYESMVHELANDVGLEYGGLGSGIAEIGRVLGGDGEMAEEVAEISVTIDDENEDEFDYGEMADGPTGDIPRLDLEQAQYRFQVWSGVIPNSHRQRTTG